MTSEVPYHAHVYYTAESRSVAQRLREQFVNAQVAAFGQQIAFVGEMVDFAVGPHPLPQYEVHFLSSSLGSVVRRVRISGLSALIHPLTNDDFRDHTTLSRWVGEPLDLDMSALKPRGQSEALLQFGKTDH